jgi:hypothetical protein
MAADVQDDQITDSQSIYGLFGCTTVVVTAQCCPLDNGPHFLDWAMSDFVDEQA